MNAALYGVGLLAFVWYILRNNHIAVRGHELPNLFGALRFLRDRLGNLRRETSEETTFPFCDGCPDREACGWGACYLDGGPNHPLDRCPDGAACAHGGRHWPSSDAGDAEETTDRPQRHGMDDDEILTVSREAVCFVDLSSEDQYETRAWKARVARESALRQADGVDLSFLNDAAPSERRAWVESWRKSHPNAPRSEIAHLLCRHGKITLRQAQADIRAALGPASQDR